MRQDISTRIKYLSNKIEREKGGFNKNCESFPDSLLKALPEILDISKETEEEQAPVCETKG